MSSSRSILSVRDASGNNLNSYQKDRQLLVRSLANERCKKLPPAEKYVPCSRFKKILHDSCIPFKHPEIVKTKCPVCDGPMKVKIFPSNKGNKKIIVEEVWRGKGQPENPQIQQVFDNWLYSNSDHCRQRQEETKETKSHQPHHYYHHNLVKKKKESQVESEKFTFCAGCPDRYRNWVRRDHPDHYIEPMLMLIRKSNVEDQELGTLEQRDIAMSTKNLKAALNSILTSDSMPPKITLALHEDGSFLDGLRGSLCC
ncbi:unnamed protein product [Nezara viridula]|uniref:Uncharacterized protein n=1 Tax=Nezara viridula TaxID=85310 RepID=A0A9P0MSN7_NEZVI|nr:unnamed protein product [Nezara viridula]